MKHFEYSFFTEKTNEEIFQQVSHQDPKISEKAKHALVLNNMGLIMKIAQRYACNQVPLEDLIQEGVFAIYKTIKSYDPCRKTLFSTYAFDKIDRQMQITIANQKDIIRTPEWVQKEIASLKKVKNNFFIQTGEDPNVQEIADFLKETPEKIEKILHYDSAVISLFSERDDDRKMIDMIPLPQKSIENRVCDKIITEKIEGIMSQKLSERNQGITRLRFGLKESQEEELYPEETFADIALKYGITKERARQIFFASSRKIYNCLLR
jgi:RNA polymerase sigma factor (sigma-70 family)